LRIENANTPPSAARLFNFQSSIFNYLSLVLTRDEAVSYYKSIAKTMLPHLRNRPLSFQRYVDAIPGEFFWEKDAPSFTPGWVKRFPVPRREGGPPIEYIVANDTRTLTWIAKVGGIEIHPFLHRVPRIDVATDLVFDLDPGEGADILDCAKVALLLRDTLEGVQLQCFPKVSGSKGLQVLVPLQRNATHAETEAFARVVAEQLARKHPELVVAKMAKALRVKKVFIDWSQNADYKTTVAAYSLRATGFVSMPVRWEELRRPRKLTWTPDEALARVRKLGDLFAPALAMKQTLIVGDRGTARRRPTKAGEAPAAPRESRSLPRPGSQSGRRLFLLTKTEMGNELWMDLRGKFKRWILRPDRTGGEKLIAMPAGDFPIDPAYFRAEVPKEWRGRVAIEDSGAYEVIEGSWARRRFDLWFTGKVLAGRWLLEKIEAGEQHRSWRLTPS
jgi:bifunctional non-homologous end joining protein LigD